MSLHDVAARNPFMALGWQFFWLRIEHERIATAERNWLLTGDYRWAPK
jgi:hypothetical protein